MNIREIPVEEIVPNEWNGSRCADKELVESVRKMGVLQPVSVVMDQMRKKYVCIYGWRRVDAAKRAGLAAVPAIVSTGMPEADARVLTLVENIHRAQQNPMTEARVCEYFAKKGRSVQEIAAKLCKSPRFVVRRLALCGICPQAEMLLEELGSYDTDAVAMLAKCTPARQMEILERTPHLAMNADEMARAITGKCPLEGAAFDGEDETLVPEAGACSACRKRTGAQRLLFGGEEMAGNSCLDSECFARKTNAAAGRRIAELREKNADAPCVVKKADYDYASEAERALYDSHRAKPLVDWRVAENALDKARADARPGILMKGGNAVPVVLVPAERQRDGRAAKPKTPEEKAENLRKRRLAWVMERGREMLDAYIEDARRGMAPWEATCESFVLDLAEALAGEKVDYAEARQVVIGAIAPALSSRLTPPPLFSMDADKAEKAIFHAFCLMRDVSEDPDKKLARLKAEAEEEIPE